MAKISLSKLISVKKGEIKTIDIGEHKLEVLTYLPLEKKIELVNKVANDCIMETGINPIQRDIQTDLAIVEYYTNISFSEKQKEDIQKTYDLLCLNDILEIVKNAIPGQELALVQGWIWMCINVIETFGNSARGILKDITTNYDGAKLDVEALIKEIKDPAMEEFVKNLPNLV